VLEGIATFHDAHPNGPVVAAGMGERLNDHGYRVPGIDDAGDRMFGTKYEVGRSLQHRPTEPDRYRP